MDCRTEIETIFEVADVRNLTLHELSQLNFAHCDATALSEVARI